MNAQRSPGGAGWLVPALLGVVAGPALQLQQSVLWPAAVYAAGVGLGLALMAWPASRARALPVLLAVAMLAFGSCGWRATAFAGRGLDPALEGRDLTLTGRVSGLPQANDVGQRFRFRVESARQGAVEVAVPPELVLSWYGGVQPRDDGGLELQRASGDLRAGDRWRFNARLKAPHGNLNPHGFDYELWLWEQGVQATGYVRSGPADPAPQRLASTWRHPVERARQAVRDAIFERVTDRRSAGLLAALVAGDQNAIERADWDVFRATGVAHLMSISGLHVTMFAWAAALLVGWAWRRSGRLCLAWPAPHAALAGGVLLATAYALFSGWGVPAQRTVWMLGAVALLRLSGRRWPWPVLWLLACAVVVTIDPWALLQPGFWLSFVAVGVLFAAGSDREAGHQPGARGAALRLAREQGVVTLALTPLSLLLFGQVSVVGLLANAVAIPWVTLLVTPLALAGVLLAPLWDAAAVAMRVLAAGLDLLAALPFATVSVAAPPLALAVAGVAGGLLLAMRLPPPVRALGLPLLLPVLLWQAPRPAEGQFEVLAADIGQGNAVIVRTATRGLVYDAGPRYSADSDAGHRVLVPLLRALGEPVAMLVVSHRDSDHSGGAAAVLQMQPRAALASSIAPDHPLRAVRPGEAPCRAGQRWRWDGVDFAFLHPAAGDDLAGVKPNAISCVLRVSNGTRTALLAGDIERPQELRLVAQAEAAVAAGQPSPLRADLLLMPHHGSKTSSSDAFLDAVQPRIALAQAGYRNRFGHPAAPVLARYEARGIRVIQSAPCGAAGWSSNQPAAARCEREAAPRYWHHRAPPAPG